MLDPMPPRVAVLTPFGSPSVRGNAVTVARIVRGLTEHGLALRLWDLSVVPAASIEREVEAYHPSLVHAFHAYRVGPLAVRLARRLEVPLVVTITGTDGNHDLFDAERAATVRRILEAATRITVFHESIGERILAALPDLRGRLAVVPQAVRLETDEPFDLAAHWPLPVPRTLFVCPAGIRMVKNPRLPLRPLAGLVGRYPELRLLYVGPILDADEGEALHGELAGRPWARHIGAVPHTQMAAMLGQADVVLNCSLSEGGMANSVLEALSMGRAVLASDIEGNRSLIEDGVTGLLFRGEREFGLQAERLLRDPALRARLGRSGRAVVSERYPPARELEGYLAAYRLLIPVPSG